MLDDAALDAERVSSEHQRRGIPFSLEENERRESTSGRIDERDGGRDERTVGALEANARGREESEYLHFEKKTRILREITDVSREILTNAEVYQGGRRGVAGERVGVRVSDFRGWKRRKCEMSGANGDANAAEMMTCSATMLRDTCKVIAFCGKDDNTVEITRMVVKILLQRYTTLNTWYSLGRFQGEEGEEALEILTLRLAHSSVACDGDVERRVVKTALVQHINNSFKRCAEGV